MTRLKLIVSIFTAARAKRRRRPRVSINLDCRAPDGREAVSILLWGQA